METKQEYLTLQQVSEITHTSLFTLRKKIRSNELKAYKPCRQYLVKKEDIEKFIDSSKKEV